MIFPLYPQCTYYSPWSPSSCTKVTPPPPTPSTHHWTIWTNISWKFGNILYWGVIWHSLRWILYPIKGPQDLSELQRGRKQKHMIWKTMDQKKKHTFQRTLKERTELLSSGPHPGTPFWHSIWHTMCGSTYGYISYIIYFDIRSGIYSDILCAIFFWHLFWHTLAYILTFFLTFYLAVYLGSIGTTLGSRNHI